MVLAFTIHPKSEPKTFTSTKKGICTRAREVCDPIRIRGGLGHIKNKSELIFVFRSLFLHYFFFLRFTGWYDPLIHGLIVKRPHVLLLCFIYAALRLESEQ